MKTIKQLFNELKEKDIKTFNVIAQNYTNEMATCLNPFKTENFYYRRLCEILGYEITDSPKIDQKRIADDLKNEILEQ
jgi:hypothetical protein